MKLKREDVRAVEGVDLERLYDSFIIEGSNPSLSVTTQELFVHTTDLFFCLRFLFFPIYFFFLFLFASFFSSKQSFELKKEIKGRRNQNACFLTPLF